MANCRTGSSSRKRGWSSGEDTRSTSDCSTSAPNAGSTSAPSSSEASSTVTPATSASVKPSLNTASRSKRSISSGSSRSMLQSSTAVIVRCRSGRSRGPAPSSAWVSRCSSVVGESSRRPGAASSRARGRPSSCRVMARQGRGGVVGHLGRRAGGRGAVEQQGDGGGAGHGLDVVGVRRGQRAQHHLVLGAHPQRCTARRQHHEVGAARDQVGKHSRRSGKLLEVVEHQEHPQASQVADQGVERVGVRCLGQPEGGGDPRDDEGGLAQGCEVDRDGTSGEGLRLASQDLEGEPRLADPTRPGDGDQPAAAVDQGAEPVDLGLAADERGRRRRRSAG